MRVILLGAGASRAACYPLASQLMEAVKAEAEGPSSKNLAVSEDWKKWQSFKYGAQGAAKMLLCDPNPEVVLSFLDLCAESNLKAIINSCPASRKPSPCPLPWSKGRGFRNTSRQFCVPSPFIGKGEGRVRVF